MVRPAIAWLIAAFLLASVSAVNAGDVVKARLASPNAAEEVSGTLTLDGFNLSGHLSGGGIDVMISGTVKSNSVEVEISGHLVVSCGLNPQSINGTAPNNGPSTSVEMAFTCDKRYMGDTYLFRLDLGLPPHHPQIPTGTDPGESA